jgi:hypothetical protein
MHSFLSLFIATGACCGLLVPADAGSRKEYIVAAAGKERRTTHIYANGICSQIPFGNLGFFLNHPFNTKDLNGGSGNHRSNFDH